jgi:CyaY protein
MDEATFDRLAADELKKLEQKLGDLPEAEVDSTGDVITMEFGDGAKYVINSHRAARQIWLSAEMRAAHYGWDAGSRRWLDDKTGEELYGRIEGALSARLGRPIRLRS